jgi:hypothetical protein
MILSGGSGFQGGPKQLSMSQLLSMWWSGPTVFFKKSDDIPHLHALTIFVYGPQRKTLGTALDQLFCHGPQHSRCRALIAASNSLCRTVAGARKLFTLKRFLVTASLAAC